MISTSRFAMALAVVGLLAACSSVPYSQRISDRKAAYAAAAGAPVPSFRFFQSFWSWEPLGDDQVVIYTRPNQAYLLEVPGCNQLPFANSIGVTSSLNEVHKGFDRVLTGRDFVPCIITQIRPVDVAHLKATQARQRKIEAEPRASRASGS